MLQYHSPQFRALCYVYLDDVDWLTKQATDHGNLEDLAIDPYVTTTDWQCIREDRPMVKAAAIGNNGWFGLRSSASLTLLREIPGLF